MSNQTKVTLVVAADVVEDVRNLCSLLAGDAGSNMFQTKLSESGTEPATHYISAGYISSAMYDLMGVASSIVNAANGYVTLEQVTNLLAQCDISEEDAPEALSRLGLKLVADSI